MLDLIVPFGVELPHVKGQKGRSFYSSIFSCLSCKKQNNERRGEKAARVSAEEDQECESSSGSLIRSSAELQCVADLAGPLHCLQV